MTPNSWFEVTPEKIGEKIAQRVFGHKHPKVILDVFCGVGGNSIQFALSPHCERVYAIDNDPMALWCARKNAELYKVVGKITFILGDFFEFSKKYSDGEYVLEDAKIDFVFCSPPWGGPSYSSQKVFDVEKMTPHGFREVWGATMAILRTQQGTKATTTIGMDARRAAFYLPRTSDLNQLARYVAELGHEAKAEAIHYCCDLRSKAMCLYIDTVGGASEEGELVKNGMGNIGDSKKLRKYGKGSLTQ